MSQSFRPVPMIALAASILCAVSAPVAAAAGADRTAFLQAFQHSYNRPADVQAALDYSREAVSIGDYEAAIPPLERILMFNPALLDIRLEVGVLYYLLNSTDMAKKHLSMVADAPDAKDALRERASTYLSRL